MKINYHLLFIVCLCILLLFCVWVNSTPSKNAITEGMGSPGGNKKYTYYPSGTASDKNRTIRLSDLKHETYEAAEFLKNKKGLIHIAPAPPPPRYTGQPVVSPEEAAAEQKDKAETNQQVNDMEQKLESMLDMSKHAAEYSKDVNVSELYKTYSDFDTNITNELNKEFDEIFSSVNLEKKKIETLSRFKEKIAYYDTAYNYTKYFVIQPTDRRKYMKHEFFNYWVNILEKHSNSQSQLDEIKLKFYAIIQPTFIFTRFCNYYKENKKMFSSKDDALLMINAATLSIRDLKYDKLSVNHEQVVSIVPTDKEDQQNTVLHLDTIQYTDIACIIYPIVLFIAYNVNEHFGIDFNEFKTEYIHFMGQKKIDSFFVFLMEHPPQFDNL